MGHEVTKFGHGDRITIGKMLNRVFLHGNDHTTSWCWKTLLLTLGTAGLDIDLFPMHDLSSYISVRQSSVHETSSMDRRA